MTDPTIRYLDLSREELAFTMERLGIATLVGLEGGPLALIAEEERPAAVAAGGRALVARGMAQQASGGPDPHWALSQLLIAAVGTCATAADYMMITQRTPALPLFAWYAHLTPGVSVLHTLADAGVHRFNLCLRPGDLQPMLCAILGCDGQPAPAGEPLEVGAEVLDVAADTAIMEPEAALNVLRGSGLDDPSAEQMLGTLRGASASSMVTRARYQDSETRLLDVFGVVSTAEGLWLTEPVAGIAGRLTVRPVAGSELSQRLVSLLDLSGGHADQFTR
jgi:hypothetical protein